jgi:hypothetical protein
MQKQAIILIQTHWKAVSARKNFLCQKMACIRIQHAVRGWLVRLKYLACREATICLQVNFLWALFPAFLS